MVVAVALVVAVGLMVVFQLALALGAPWGAFAWGGSHRGTLPRGYRIASLVAAIVHAGIALVILDLAGVVDVLPTVAAQVLAWVAFGVFALGVLMNAISRSRAERFTMTPVALVLAVLSLLVALQGAVPQTFTGMVLDAGNGPVFCTLILESYPPQCGDGTPIDGWSWPADAEQSQGTRWGEYTFTGARDDGVIRVVSAPAAR